MTKATAKKQTKTERQAALRAPRKDKGKKRKSADVVTITPEPDAIPAPATGPIKGSVVQAHWKAKAGKVGVWRSDKLNDAVRNAFLSESSNEVEPAAAARIATDKILSENGLDVGRWAGKNAGMLSMNLRNVLRGLLRNDGVVFVYGKKID